MYIHAVVPVPGAGAGIKGRDRWEHQQPSLQGHDVHAVDNEHAAAWQLKQDSVVARSEGLTTSTTYYRCEGGLALMSC